MKKILMLEIILTINMTKSARNALCIFCAHCVLCGKQKTPGNSPGAGVNLEK